MDLRRETLGQAPGAIEDSIGLGVRVAINPAVTSPQRPVTTGSLPQHVDDAVGLDGRGHAPDVGKHPRGQQVTVSVCGELVAHPNGDPT
jgi:hypothetical protein